MALLPKINGLIVACELMSVFQPGSQRADPWLMQLLDNIKENKGLLYSLELVLLWLLWWFHFKGKEPQCVVTVPQHFMNQSFRYSGGFFALAHSFILLLLFLQL